MNDVYKEILVKKQKTSADTAKKAGLIALVIVVAAAGIFIFPVLLAVAVALGFVSSYLIQNLNVEYEYLYVNGDIDVDRIMNQTRRKKAASFDLSALELMAPSASHELDEYSRRKDVKYLDFTSGDAKAVTYTGVYSSEKGTELVKLELDEEILKDLRRQAPRKISRECFF